MTAILLVGNVFAQQKNSTAYRQASVVTSSFHITGGAAFSASKDFKQAYNNNMGDMGLNVGCGFLINPFVLGRAQSFSPVLVGMDFNFNYLGRDKYTFSNAAPIKREYWIGNFGALVRLDPMNDQSQHVRFFADGFAGWGRYWANTKIDKNLLETVIDDQQYLTGMYNDNNFTWGVGGGLLFGKAGNSKFMLRAMYYFNGEYTVIDRNTMQISNNTLTYKVKNVNANMFTVQMGVSFETLKNLAKQ